MKALRARFHKTGERFEALNLRERSLVSLAVLVVMYLIWDTALMSPEHLRQKHLVGDMYALNEQMTEMDAQLQGLTASLKASEVPHQQQRIRELRESLRGLASRQAALTVEFIQPQQMAGVLRDLLGTEGGLRLRKLESLGVMPLFPPPAKDEAGEAAPGPRIYRHGMRITFEGDYFATLRYLQALEAMPWRLYWDELDYQVQTYPQARVSITVHTLSLEEGWLGV